MTKLTKKIFLGCLFSALPSALLAEGNITGKVLDKESGEPVEFASVQLIDATTQKPLAIGTSTGADGTFILTSVPDGKYVVRITNLGSVEQERPATVAGADVSVGTVKIAEDAKMLQEVVVQGVKGQMRFELDRKVFNVDANIAAAGASASELLESIPSVEVDQDGEVSLRGDSSVTIWLNGKESGLTADNRAQILEQIPAETIERIEVITNPSAKYSPEGTSGIINIVLKKDRRGGYFGSAEFNVNQRGGGNVGLNINYNTARWETFAGLGFRMMRNKGGGESRRNYNDHGYFLNSDSKSPNHGLNGFLRLGATFHATDKDDIYFTGFGMLGHRTNYSSTEYSSNLPDHWTDNSTQTKQMSDHRGAHAELGYQHKWNDLHTLDINVGYNAWGTPQHSIYYQEQSWGDEDDLQTVYQNQEQKIRNGSWSAKVDYVNQVLPWLKLEAGFNGDYSHENSPVSTMQGSTEANAVQNLDLYNRFIYDNNISALYATLGGKYRSFSFSVGLRGEAWQTRANSELYEDGVLTNKKFSKNNFALFPSAFISWALPYDNEVQINYTRRIRRPWGGQLNSFRNISNPTNISYGNPELQPMYTNAFELNYIKSWTYHMISLSAYWRQSSDLMERISYLDENVMYTTWANASKRTNLGAELVVKNNLFKVLDLTTTLNLYNTHLQAWDMVFTNSEGQQFDVSGAGRNDFAWDIRCMASVRLPWGLSFQATGRYNSRMITAQGSREPGWSVDAGLRKNLGNWSFSLNCRDIFDSRKFSSFTQGADYEQWDKRWRGGRTIRLTIKYSFGNMKAKRNTHQQGGEPADTSGYGGEEY